MSKGMTKEEAIKLLVNATYSDEWQGNEDLTAAHNMAIEALEMVEEFEKAQIITGGRLNGRTYAYKCGLEDGKRKALEQEKYYKDLAQSYERTIVELTEAIAEQQPSDDCVSREQALLSLTGKNLSAKSAEELIVLFNKRIKALPPVTPTQRWIPMVRREPTDEEKAEFLAQNGEELGYVLENKMPFNGQEVLVSTGKYVSEDVYDEDFYNFESIDIENVDAWMPLPKPYEEEMGVEE